MRGMGLSLIVGPANAGKVELLLERYLAVLENEPVLIVPNRSDVDRVERELVSRCGALLGGTIGTFDDLFRRLAGGSPNARPVASDAQRALVVRRALTGASLNGLGASARFSGFADALLGAVGELESGLLDPESLEGDLGSLYARYREAATYMALGTPKSAAESYQQVISAGGDTLYAQVAKLGLAEAQAQTGEYDAAINTFRELSQHKDGQLPVDGLLMRLGEWERVLVLSLHHIVTDGWSQGVLTRELSELLKCRLARRVCPRPTAAASA